MTELREQMEAVMKPEPLLDIRDLSISFRAADDYVDVVSGVNLTIGHGEAVSLVGESGSGKTVTALSIAGLLPSSVANRTSGCILFKGQDLLKANGTELNGIRGAKISYIFQEPGTALNPVFTVRQQIDEVLRLHQPDADRNSRVDELLRDVGIDETSRVASSYPHQISGGQQQRVMIAIALACEPDLLIADEPTTALDVTVQAQILDLLKDLRAKHRMSILIITHNLAIAAGLAQRMYVMYAGQIVETGIADELIKAPHHPYSRALLNAVPRLRGEKATLEGIGGAAPAGGEWPNGCRFHPRCSIAKSDCSLAAIDMVETSADRSSRCTYWKEAMGA